MSMPTNMYPSMPHWLENQSMTYIEKILGKDTYHKSMKMYEETKATICYNEFLLDKLYDYICDIDDAKSNLEILYIFMGGWLVDYDISRLALFHDFTNDVKEFIRDIIIKSYPLIVNALSKMMEFDIFNGMTINKSYEYRNYYGYEILLKNYFFDNEGYIKGVPININVVKNKFEGKCMVCNKDIDETNAFIIGGNCIVYKECMSEFNY